MTLSTSYQTYALFGAALNYGAIQVTDPTGARATASYPAHFAFNAGGALVNPATDDTLQALLNATQALTAALNAAVLQNTASLAALIATLPTTLPSTSGQLWRNGGVLSIS